MDLNSNKDIIDHKKVRITLIFYYIFRHTCIDKTVEECKFIEISVPFTEVVDQCVSKNVKSCKKAWACLDNGWTDDKDKEICQNHEYRDSDDCVTLPQDICTQKKVTIFVKNKKRECKDIVYTDCSAKVTTETCVEDHVRVPTPFQQNVPFKVCGSDKWKLQKAHRLKLKCVLGIFLTYK